MLFKVLIGFMTHHLETKDIEKFINVIMFHTNFWFQNWNHGLLL